MSAPAPTPIGLDVRGGPLGLAAELAGVGALAATLTTLGAEVGRVATDDATLAGDVADDLLVAGWHDPGEAAAAARLLGHAGALAAEAASRLLADASALVVAVTALREADAAAEASLAALLRSLGWGAGAVAGYAAPPLAGLGATTAGLGVLLWPVLPADLRGRLADDAARAGADLEDWLLAHPALVQAAVAAAPAFATGLVTAASRGALRPGWYDVAHLAGAAGGAYRDGAPVLRAVPPVGAAAPPTLGRLLDRLAEVADAPAGTVEVQTFPGPDGRPRHVVLLPGTDDLTTLPGRQDADLRDLGTDLRVMAGISDAYGRGVLEAMAAAGIRPDEPVLLVGHSLGGIEAVTLAARGSAYDVTDVVTAGSPTAQVDALPDGVRVLSLENRGDLVPLLDGADNPDTATRVTVTADLGGEDALARHDVHRYAALAGRLDASTDPRVVEAIERLRSSGFLGAAGPGVARRFVLTRG